ncbi:ArsR/SmtB family transcription factor [Altererythrobacter litoralis]|uniref:Metalloregulator ArsR/SmtB family transcription factor n=1 Tax=Altererythrobacter litoralis TaxID=3113904 RepID=A0ABU7GCK7_9SPHN|nr:metalloregulator ArsR/SmtB family transcription factor [Erythrobacteraceae bacterium 1XM1-14]
MELSNLTSFDAMRANAGKAAEYLAMLSSRPRLLILCHLAEAGELPVGEMAIRIGLSQSALSQHLAKLRAEGLVAFRREAQTLLYRVADPKAGRLLDTLHDIFCDAAEAMNERGASISQAGSVPDQLPNKEQECE